MDVPARFFWKSRSTGKRPIGGPNGCREGSVVAGGHRSFSHGRSATAVAARRRSCCAECASALHSIDQQGGRPMNTALAQSLPQAADYIRILPELILSLLARFRRREAASAESSLQYFLVGSFATAFFLYGVALMFGAAGSTNIDKVSQALQANQIPTLAYLAVALMFVGLGFKVASAPF